MVVGKARAVGNLEFEESSCCNGTENRAQSCRSHRNGEIASLQVSHVPHRSNGDAVVPQDAPLACNIMLIPSYQRVFQQGRSVYSRYASHKVGLLHPSRYRF